jgi:hypothetical protein
MPAAFKPAEPRIPGVPDRNLEPTAASRAKKAIVSGFALLGKHLPGLLGPLAVIAGIGYGVYWWVHGGKSKLFEPADVAIVHHEPLPVKVDGSLPVAPGEIATTDDLDKVWSSKRFVYREPGSGEFTSAMIVHLPGGTYWAFSLREPYGNCVLEYLPTPLRIQTDYNFHSDHPLVGDPCNHTLYDLLGYGMGPNGKVRGEIVQGTGLRPPVAIEIEVHAKKIVAGRME